MKLNIKSIKRTRLGRLWLAEFVRLIWESLSDDDRCTLLPLDRKPAPGVYMEFNSYAAGLPKYRRSLAGRRLFGFGLIKDSRGWPLTALGAEVAAHGRRS